MQSNYVPRFHDYYFGKIQFGKVVAFLPFGQRVLQLDAREYHSHSILTWLITQGAYGTGTTAVADLYLDFGVVSVGIGCLLFGVFAKAVQLRSAGTESVFWTVAYACLVASCCIVARFSLLEHCMREILHPAILAFVVCKVWGVPTQS